MKIENWWCCTDTQGFISFNFRYRLNIFYQVWYNWYVQEIKREDDFKLQISCIEMFTKAQEEINIIKKFLLSNLFLEDWKLLKLCKKPEILKRSKRELNSVFWHQFTRQNQSRVIETFIICIANKIKIC